MSLLTIPILESRHMLKKAALFLFFALFIFGSFNVQAQELDEIKLAKILAKSDSIRKTLIYTGVVKLQQHIQGDSELLKVWRNKNKFYHHQSITEKKDKNDSSRNGRRGSSRRESSDFRFMPEQKYIKLLLKNYSVSFVEAKPIAGRKTLRLTIKPKYLPRFGLNLWFDKERFHILQREINYYEPESKTKIISMAYQDIQFDIMPPDSLLNAQKRSSRGQSERSKRPKKIEYQNLVELKEKFHKPIYTPKFIPAGCELMSIKSTKDKHRDVVEMHYADGILNLSMFQSWGKQPGFVKRLLDRSSSEHENKIDFRQVYAVKKGETIFILVGNFCIQQMKKMADSLVVNK